MVYRRKRYGRRKKRTYRSRAKRYYRKYSRRSYPKVLAVGMPSKYLCKMRYGSNITLNASASGYLVYQEYRVNSLYDFDYTGGGHQPTPYDQIKTFYSRFRVLGCKLTATPVYGGPAAVATVFYGWAREARQDEIQNYTLDDIMQTEGVNNQKLKMAGITALAGYQGTNAYRTFYWSGKKQFGRDYNTDDDYSHLEGGNPVSTAFAAFWACATSAEEPPALQFYIQAEFIVLCTEPTKHQIS